MLRHRLGEILQLQQRGGAGQLQRAPSHLSIDPLWGFEVSGGLQTQRSRRLKQKCKPWQEELFQFCHYCHFFSQ